MISQTAEYALRAMAWLALTPEERVPSSVIADKTKVPTDYLAKVLQLLAESRLIEGRRGVRGGYRLARSAEEIKLVEVINAVSRGDMQVKRIETCPLGLDNHGPNLCALHRTMDRAIEAVLEVLDDATLADLVSSKSGPSRPLCDSETTAMLSIGAKKRS